MEEFFKKLIKNITLTSKQNEDAKIKYTGVCKCIHKEFYDSEYDGSTKLLFGSYRKKTAIRPITEDQDVDVLFKIPEDAFEQYKSNKNGQAALLQKIRGILLDSKYALGEKPKAWGKIILVTTADGTHNIELLPAFERDDKSFIIPNTENDGSWDEFNPRSETERFKKSNAETRGLTRDLIKMVKRWKQENSTLDLKSYIIDNYAVCFLTSYTFTNYPQLIFDFFKYLDSNEKLSFTEQAKNRAKKAIKYLSDDKENKAREEYEKIFGSSFPVVIKQISEIKHEIAPKEEFIENIVEVNLNNNFFVKTDCLVDQKGFRSSFLSKLIGKLRKNKSLEFFIKKTNIPKPFSVKWKVRNFGDEAEERNDLRGEITDDLGWEKKKENTKYRGEHFVECYIIKDRICVATDRIKVPISNFN